MLQRLHKTAVWNWFCKWAVADVGSEEGIWITKEKGSSFVSCKEVIWRIGWYCVQWIVDKILKECNYRAGYARWDFKTFDILMDGVLKEEDQG